MLSNFEEWNKLVQKFKNKSFANKNVRYAFEKEFTELSAKLLQDENAADVASMWCTLETVKETKTVKDAYEEAYAYLEYTVDRMCINRWLYIRLLLNTDIE